MHVSEGVLSAPVLLGAAIPAAAGVAYGLKRLDAERLVQAGVMSAAFFVASLVHFPFGPGSVHLLLGGLLGAFLGWGAFPAIAVALLLQALLFQFGGLTTLGVNCLIMALPAVLCGTLVRRSLQGPGLGWRAFACGALSVALSAALFCLALLLSSRAFGGAALAVLAANLPVMLIEGLATAACVRFFQRVQPELLGAPGETA